MALGHAEKPKQIQDIPLLKSGHTYASITDKISGIILTLRSPLGWYVGLALGAILFVVYLLTIGFLFTYGVGIWGINIPVGWGFAIIMLVWWIGIGHAGTLISAILLLFRQQWRTSINRFAEAMTLFAVAAAGLFPILHLGRPWVMYWIMPYPNTFGLWPQFRSPLAWDVFAITAYATTSALFWYVGLIPDMATMRDKATFKPLKYLFGMMAVGWRGSGRHWHRYNSLYLLLAAIATPLVVSVHTVISFDFAISIMPGWHTTVLPPYFVAGAIFSGFAMVVTLMIPMRKMFKLEDFITLRHFDLMAKVLLATGLIVVYGYIVEAFAGWYSGSQYEIAMLKNRFFGPYAGVVYLLVFCNAITIQLLWFKKVRTNLVILFVISLVVNTGMFLERFMIIVISLTRDYMPSAWGNFIPTQWDWGIMIGSMGFFLVMMFIFVRALPMISIFEVRELLHDTKHTEHAAEAGAEA